jgi:hypothetical protein
MLDLQKLKDQLLAHGIVDEEAVDLICRKLYADGKIDKKEVEFLVALRKEAQLFCPTFEQLFFQAVKHHILADGCIDAEEARLLQQIVHADGKIDVQEKRFLRELKHEAKQVGPEFRQLYDECMKDEISRASATPRAAT